MKSNMQKIYPSPLNRRLDAAFRDAILKVSVGGTEIVLLGLEPAIFLDRFASKNTIVWVILAYTDSVDRCLGLQVMLVVNGLRGV